MQLIVNQIVHFETKVMNTAMINQIFVENPTAPKICVLTFDPDQNVCTRAIEYIYILDRPIKDSYVVGICKFHHNMLMKYKTI